MASLGVGLGIGEGGVLGKWLNNANINNGQIGTTQTNKKTCERYADIVDTINITNDDSDTAALSKLNQAKSALDGAIEMCNYVVPQKSRAAMCRKSNVEEASDTSDAIAALSIVKADAASVKSSCQNADDNYSPGASNQARAWVPIATTVAGGGLGLGITASVIAAKKEDIKNKAVAEWMEDIGEHIQCFVGTDELGSYGDTIAIEID